MAWHLGGQTDDVSKYLRLKFSRLHTGSIELPDMPRRWSLDYLTEVDLAAHILYQAYNNQGSFRCLIPNLGLINIGSSHRMGCGPVCRPHYRPKEYCGRCGGQIESQIPTTISRFNAPHSAGHGCG